jgi:hypothetical protein
MGMKLSLSHKGRNEDSGCPKTVLRRMLGTKGDGSGRRLEKIS